MRLDCTAEGSSFEGVHLEGQGGLVSGKRGVNGVTIWVISYRGY